MARPARARARDNDDELSVDELEVAAGGDLDPANGDCLGGCGNANCFGACGPYNQDPL
ncbi:hypothetical protein [Longimicrobium sp.]|uniref:hypothetical protein n=1 Tax=Longimicrobium sp. TaxID=2029185 RepID=UPI002C971491|nr:hypothetical protein [Longimicrobium sp.]HSU14680.1 hypothetical protein [Longimicrobium sp.]